MMSKNAKPPTKAERDRMAEIHRRGTCVACAQWGHQRCGATEVDHLIIPGKRRGHRFTVALGSWHHRGIVLPGETPRSMLREYGPSRALSTRAFHAEFGPDDHLLSLTDKLIGWDEPEPARPRNSLTSSKIISRGDAR